MTFRPDIMQMTVDSGSSNWYYTNLPDAPFTVKNIGLVTCYAGVVHSGSPLASSSTGFPILPGETVTFPASDGTNDNVVGFNTTAGSTKLAIIGSVEE